MQRDEVELFYMDGEYNETAPNMYYTWNNEEVASTSREPGRREDFYQEWSNNMHLDYNSWQPRYCDERPREYVNQYQTQVQKPPWQMQARCSEGQQPYRSKQWQFTKHKNKNTRPLPLMRNKWNQNSQYSDKKCFQSRGKDERSKPTQIKFAENIPQNTNSALTWAEAVSSLSIEDPVAKYDPREPTITDFDLANDEAQTETSTTETVDVKSPHLEVAIVSVPATDLDVARSKMVELKIGDLAESFAANSNSNVAVSFVGIPVYSESDNGLYLHCQNGETIRWLEGVISYLEPLWDGCKLKLRKYERPSEIVKCFIYIPCCSTNLGLVCKALRGFNPTYQVHRWEFYSFQRRMEEEKDRSGCGVVVGIPDDVLVKEILPNKRKVKYRLISCLLRFFTPLGKLVTRYPPTDTISKDATSSVNNVANAPAEGVGKSAEQSSELQSNQSIACSNNPSTSEAIVSEWSEPTDAHKTGGGSNAVQRGSGKEVPKWWTLEVNEQRKLVRRLFNRAKNTRRTEDWNAHRQAQIEYKKLIRRRKNHDFELMRDMDS